MRQAAHAANQQKVVPLAGIGPATSPLPRECSTTEPQGRSIGQDGAGNEIRTRDLNLGKVALYQLSYSRIATASAIEKNCQQMGLLANGRLLITALTICPYLRSLQL
jgi:hypothetical protein